MRTWTRLPAKPGPRRDVHWPQAVSGPCLSRSEQGPEGTNSRPRTHPASASARANSIRTNSDFTNEETEAQGLWPPKVTQHVQPCHTSAHPGRARGRALWLLGSLGPPLRQSPPLS